jgi:hypothetical protein
MDKGGICEEVTAYWNPGDPCGENGADRWQDCNPIEHRVRTIY